MRLPQYQVYRAKGGDWRWRLRAANSEIVASGEGYKRRSGAINGVAAFRRAAQRAVLRFI